MNKKIVLVASLIISASLRGAATDTVATPEVTTSGRANPVLMLLIRTGFVVCPNPDCSKKKDALPKMVKTLGGIYHCGYSFSASCPTCGDKRDIRYYEN